MPDLSSIPLARWKVAVTRDEPPDGPMHEALRRHGFEPQSCPVLEERAPADPEALRKAAGALHEYDWLICASARSVRALRVARQAPWPRGLCTAAVGEATAEALVGAGADPPPIVASESGAQALCAHLLDIERWANRRVLVPGVEGGRRELVDGLAAAGAVIDEIEAYRMRVRPDQHIKHAWSEAASDAAVITSPSVGRALIAALGVPPFLNLRALVAIGATTAAALAEYGIHAETPKETGFEPAARRLAELRARA
ncbi:MAG: uroporphyrinogen-III synthase [Vicinamibacteria bacterium]|nr:uroporphyrinogen-III synthase [Vicinamibacteria bacterium]